MASEPAVIALVGAGRMGSVHLEALKRASGVRLAGVVEPSPVARERVANAGAKTWASVDELLAGPLPDGVLIATPSDQHAELVATFAEAGVAMLCEKPVGVSVGEARAACAAAADAGVLLQVGYWRRFVPALRSLRERILAGSFGEIIQLACFQWDHELPSDEFRAHSGGIAVDMGVHEFDQARWLLGQEFGSVWAVGAGAGSGVGSGAGAGAGFGSGVGEPADDPDHATVLASMSGGSAVVVSLGRRFPLEDSCWVEVWGTDGYERVTFMWDADGQRVFLDSMVLQVEAFGRALGGGMLEGADAEDAVIALTVAGRATSALGAEIMPVGNGAVEEVAHPLGRSSAPRGPSPVSPGGAEK